MNDRLATIHQRYRQTEDRQRSRSLGRTVTCNGRPKTKNNAENIYIRLPS